ncbi:MAG: hypothetical protein GY792_19665 [Gammaproteobacteria bacterium]|nr:hypothetical protein [Gammaproteobacteria bacterium]
MKRIKSVSIVVAVSLFLISGCSLGPRLLQDGYLSYNDRVRATTDEELLLNIVRLRYLDTIEFLSVSSISAQASFDVSLGAEIIANDTSSALVIPELSYSDRPTFSFVPQRGSKFAKRLVEPIKVDTLAYLAASDWPIKILMQLLVKEINGIVNESHGDFEVFNSLADEFGGLQKKNKLLVAFTEYQKPVSAPIQRKLIKASDLISAAKAGYTFVPEKDGIHSRLSQSKPQPIIWLRTDPQQVSGLLQRLKIAKHDDEPIELHAGTKHRLHSPDYDGIHLRTRSVLGGIVYLAQGVTPPSAHIEQNLTFSSWPFPGPYNNMDDIFRVHTSLVRPQTTLAVKHRGYWFYIDETDLTSKSTFLVLSEIYRLALIGADRAQAPLLTLPLGGSK